MPTVSNFPTKPNRQGIASNAFPSDLPSDFCTTMTFQSSGGASMVSEMVKLPLPKRINDMQNIIWEELGLTSMGVAAMGAQNAVDVVSVLSQQAINPYMFMLFKRPQFKEHTLQWVLSPDSQQESDKLKSIIKTLKKASLPSQSSYASFLMNYPSTVQVTLSPKEYLFEFKPCVIQSVQVDYTGSGLSFFDSKAPTVVYLTLQLKENKLWMAEDIT